MLYGALWIRMVGVDHFSFRTNIDIGPGLVNGSHVAKAVHNYAISTGLEDGTRILVCADHDNTLREFKVELHRLAVVPV